MGKGFRGLSCWLLSALVLAGPALAAMPPIDRLPGAELQVFVENDMLAGTDRYYSNGIKVGGGIPFAVLQLPARETLDRLVDDADAAHLGLFLGQNIYTPRDISLTTPQPGDRPWAGWLYLGGIAQRIKGNRLDTVEFDVGMVGPAALGEAVQTRWHRLIGSPKPMGWDHQLPNEPAFQLAYLGKLKQRAGAVEFIPHAGLTLGTVTSLVRLGGIVRVGQHMSGFGPDTIDPGGAMLQNMRRESEPVPGEWEWYGFAGVDHRLVAHNIFLDGTVFRDSVGVDRNRHVYDYQLGLSARWHEFRVSLTRIWRSPEFAGPMGNQRQTFDSLNLGVEF